MNIYSVVASFSILIVTVSSTQSTEKDTNADNCKSIQTCDLCVQKKCEFINCLSEKKSLCTNNASAEIHFCDSSMVITEQDHCNETVTTTTAASVSTSTAKPSPSTRDGTGSGKGFSGPSFIGGIVLAFGLMAIAVISFKFYKARTEANYHTL